MKIVPATLLKVGSRAQIVDIVDDVNTESSSKVIKRLMDVGFVPGSTVKLQSRNGDIFSLKVGDDNPFALGKDIAKKINVGAEDADVFEREQASKNNISIKNEIIKILAFVKNKFSKN